MEWIGLVMSIVGLLLIPGAMRAASRDGNGLDDQEALAFATIALMFIFLAFACAAAIVAKSFG